MATASTEPTANVFLTQAEELDPQRFRALGVIAIAQLMIVLDASVVTIALPSAQRALHISVANRQWALTAYTLAFGGLLLIGGRLADFLGRKRMFIISLLGFAAASALGGAAQDQAMLFGARALQGAFAAVMAPASLSLLTVTFTEAKERARAFGVYGAMSGGGAAIGLVIGGALDHVRLLALDAAHQRADRHNHCVFRDARIARERVDGRAGATTSRERYCDRGPAIPRLRLHPGRN